MKANHSLASLQDAIFFFHGSRGFRCAPTPGYLLQPLRGKELHLLFKDHLTPATGVAENK